MLDTARSSQIKRMTDAMSDAQGRIYIISLKLQSFGLLLERQGEESEGFTELEGLGMAIKELGEDLFLVWRNLDSESVPSRPGRTAK